ncbi:MAG: response regulator [Acidobacteriota bacterium]|nr:response regulator [Acidobacteriota bacterium]
MNLADARLKQLDNPSLTANERVLLRCRLAAEFIHIGQYEVALEALGELWPGIGERPNVKGLKPLTAAEVLLQSGVLSGWLGSARHITGVQDRVKDLLFEALRMFKSQRQHVKVSEAQYELGMCYWRLGAFDEARVVLDEALKGLGEQDAELKAKILIRHTLVEVWIGRYHDALNVLEKAREFFESCGDALKGRWHGQRGIVLRRLATAERRADYADRAIIEFTAAIYHYEQAGHERYCAINLNNLAMLLYQLGRYSEAHENLDRATRIFERRQDSGILAQVNETRARVFVAEGRYKEANRIISGVIQSFQKGGESALLADALTIQGVVWARLGVHESSLHVLRHAMGVAQDSGSFTNAGLAALTLIEEHGRERLSDTELFDVYRRADDLLKNTQDAEEIERLRACARIMGRRLVGARLSEKGFVLTDVVLAYEAKFIREALEAEQGSVSRAARRLGIRHQSLSRILKARHQDLLSLRTPAKTRRRSLIRHASTPKRHAAKKRAWPTTVLHVEDHKVIAEAVKETLELEGWRVVTCGDGAAALKTLAGNARYELLIVDNHLPNVNGLEVVRYARQLPHRRKTPIIMLSASEAEAEARSAGADVFLRKPQDIGELTAIVSRLLPKGNRETGVAEG